MNKTIITKELEQQIISYMNEHHSVNKTAQHFHISRHYIKKITGWKKDDYLKYRKANSLNKEEKKARKYNYEKQYLNRPEIRAKKNLRQRNNIKKHSIKRMVKNANLRSDSQGNKLNNLDVFKQAKKQKLICAISGRKMTANNISLDHIQPIAQGGLNVPNNIQLVEYEINIMKRAMTEKEFFDLIELIYLNQKNKKSPEINRGI